MIEYIVGFGALGDKRNPRAVHVFRDLDLALTAYAAAKRYKQPLARLAVVVPGWPEPLIWDDELGAFRFAR